MGCCVENKLRVSPSTSWQSQGSSPVSQSCLAWPPPCLTPALQHSSEVTGEASHSPGHVPWTPSTPSTNGAQLVPCPGSCGPCSDHGRSQDPKAWHAHTHTHTCTPSGAHTQTRPQTHTSIYVHN